MASNREIVVEEPAHFLVSPRVLCGAAVLTVAAVVVAVLAVREVTVRVLHPDPRFTPLSLGSPIVAAIGCTIVAIYVFVGIVSYPNPVRTWRRVSAVVLILSLLPCVLLAISHIMGGGWPEACALMTMHRVEDEDPIVGSIEIHTVPMAAHASNGFWTPRARSLTGRGP
jgi:uncharacterized membrane protein